jgi:serine/threonine protein kinase
MLGDKYEIIDEVAAGGMGRILKVRQIDLDRVYAAKCLAHSVDSESTQRLVREARILSQLHHENVVGVNAVIMDKNEGCVVIMDYLDGVPLSKMIADGTVDFSQALSLAKQICAGLHAAHEKGVLHRDLKPSNVMVVASENKLHAKLIDFGLAKFVDAPQSLTRPGMVMGSPAYMSPEQFVGIPLDARSDIYSLGCLLYELFCGSPPFTDSNAVDLAAKHTMQEPQAPSDRKLAVPPGIDYIILKCLSKNPSRRYQSADAVLLALEDPQTMPAPRSREHARTRVIPLWLSISAALILGVLLAVICTLAWLLLYHGSNGKFDRHVGQIENLVQQADETSLQQASDQLSEDINLAAAHGLGLSQLCVLDRLMAQVLMLQGDYDGALRCLHAAESDLLNQHELPGPQVIAEQTKINLLRAQLYYCHSNYILAADEVRPLLNSQSVKIRAQAHALRAQAYLFLGPKSAKNVVGESSSLKDVWTKGGADLPAPYIMDAYIGNALLLRAEALNVLHRFTESQVKPGDYYAEAVLRNAEQKLHDYDRHGNYSDSALARLRLQEAQAELLLGLNQKEQARLVAANVLAGMHSGLAAKNAYDKAENDRWLNWMSMRLQQLELVPASEKPAQQSAK